jgi:hypothetical protein
MERNDIVGKQKRNSDECVDKWSDNSEGQVNVMCVTCTGEGNNNWTLVTLKKTKQAITNNMAADKH